MLSYKGSKLKSNASSNKHCSSNVKILPQTISAQLKHITFIEVEEMVTYIPLILGISNVFIH